MRLLQMSISGAVMILAVIVIRALAINRLPKKTFSILWGIVLLRLLVPFQFSAPFTAHSLVEQHISATGAMGLLFPSQPVELPTAGDMLQVQAVGLISPYVIIWGIGMIACALFFVISYFKCRREFRESLPVKNAFLTKWLAEHKRIRSIEIRQYSRISTPLTYGIFKPIILMPKSTKWENTKQLEYILAHEFVHIRRFDVATKLFLAAALCIHWFNPLVWAMYILSNRDIELSCDETVVRSFGDAIRSAYAHTLISMAEKKNTSLPLCNNFSKNATEERITAIMKIKKTSFVGITLAAVLIAGTTVFAASSVPQSDEGSVKLHYFQDENGDTSAFDGKIVQQARRIAPRDLSENASFITKEEATKMDEEISKPRERTAEELKKIIADIESGKIKPLDLAILPADATVTIVDSDGNETVLKQSQAVLAGSALDALHSK